MSIWPPPVRDANTQDCIVLIDDESRKSSFLNGLGISKQNPLMCVAHIPTKYFVYQLHNIYVTDEKLIDHIRTKDGIIVLFSKITPELLKRIDELERQVGDIPVMYVLDNANDSHKTSELGANRKFFKYTKDADTDINQLALYHSDSLPNPEDFPQSWFLTKIREYGASKRKALNPHESIRDAHFVKLFEDTKLPMKLWDHYGRLRIVYYSLALYGFDNTIDQTQWLCTNWRKYKKSIGHEHLWNYTLTRFWIEILEGLRHKYANFKEIWEARPQIHNGNLHTEFYTKEQLFNPHARTNWVIPTDLKKFAELIA